MNKLFNLSFAVASDLIIKDSSSTEWRGFMNTLIETGLLNVKISCKQLKRILEKSKLLPVTSQSRSRQWAMVNIGDALNNDIKINIESIKFIINNMFHQLNILPVNDDKMKQIMKFYSYILRKSVNNTKYLVFAKVGARSPKQDIDNMLQNREEYFYKVMNKLVISQRTPHIATIIFSLNCSKGSELGKLLIDKNKEVELDEYFKNFFGYKILVTEMMSKSLSFFDCINKFDVLNNESFIYSIFFQLVYTLQIFKMNNFVHNDLHLDNLMIEILDEPFNFFYVLNNNEIISLRSKFFLRIFDFDRSYQLNNKRYGKTGEVDIYDFVYNQDKKLDFFFVCRWIEFTLSQRNSKGTILQREINKILYRKSDPNNYYFNKKPIWADINTESNRNIIKMCYDVDEWMKEFIGFSNRLKNFRVYNSLKSIPVDKRSEIFIKKYNEILTNDIMLNKNWINLPTLNQMIICHPLLVDDSLKKLSEKIINTIDNNLMRGGSKKSLYFDKYLSYKKRYLQLKY